MAIELGADALGFNFYERSTRYLKGDLNWLRALAPYVSRVAVLVNVLTPEAACRWREEGLVDAVQLHGDETPELCRSVVSRGIPVTRALRVSDDVSVSEPEHWGTSAILLDACQPGAYGGTGECLDWGVAERFVVGHPGMRVILSGGLNPSNVAEAVRQVRPFAVDVASGVEDPREPRRKDRARVRDFIQAAKGTTA